MASLWILRVGNCLMLLIRLISLLLVRLLLLLLMMLIEQSNQLIRHLKGNGGK
ncbi:UNVERIFIED_CONTAM: hypothetical protein GTU68_000117 [Idotea baltica]|nr:hypothetical protein [Idotea baltica]